MDSIRSALSTLTDWLDWLPNGLVAVVIVALSVTIAYSLHKSARRLLRSALASRYPHVLTVVQQMRGVTRLALILVALSISVPVAPFRPVTAEWIGTFMLIAVIATIGWAAITALRIGADIYLLQYRLDTDDNLLARKHYTQVRVLLRALDVLVVLFTISAALMTFEPVRQYGVSLFASAGVAGLIAGFAAKPVLSNLFAGVQLAMTQPIRIDDAVIVENEWGWVEEITSTYVVLRLWDWRRLIVPLTYFIEKPFQNWTRETSALIGTAMIYADYTAPVEAIREELHRIAKASPLWDGKVVNLQVTECKGDVMELRCLVSASSAPKTFDIRCEVREKLIDFLQREYPGALPRQRTDMLLDTESPRLAGDGDGPEQDSNGNGGRRRRASRKTADTH